RAEDELLRTVVAVEKAVGEYPLSVEDSRGALVDAVGLGRDRRREREDGQREERLHQPGAVEPHSDLAARQVRVARREVDRLALRGRVLAQPRPREQGEQRRGRQCAGDVAGAPAHASNVNSSPLPTIVTRLRSSAERRT